MKSLGLSFILLSLCNCQTNYRKESVSVNESLRSPLKNDLSVDSEDAFSVSKELIKYELNDDSDSFCEAVEQPDDCLDEETSQLNNQ